MVEAMACGTPVIAFNRGSVPEVVENNVNGLIVHNLTQMIEAVKEVHLINRQTCRLYAFNKYDVSVIANDYLSSIF